ncbi:MAG: UDP-N-acetylmuramate dehydrogenase [Deltaproteobacteria bacterium]|nr:UDP-N-acetylmuramate dehydrogenase [Deltaproteobacteria bacterium]
MIPEFLPPLLSSLRGKILWNEPLSAHTSLKVGGRVHAYIFPKDVKEVCDLIHALEKNHAHYKVLGDGSNFLPTDEDFSGVILNLAALDEISILEETPERILVQVGAGVSKQKLLFWAASKGFSGIEFLSGIPGQVGGGLFMNAGTHLGSFSDVAKKVFLVTQKGEVEEKALGSDDFSYRAQSFSKNKIIVDCVLRFTHGNPKEIEEKVKKMIAERKAAQPLNTPNCGSVFKNPNGNSAGKLIESAGLKEYRVGNAMVSPKHANFIVNLGGATAKDILSIIQHVKKTVKELKGVELQEEVVIAPSSHSARCS